MPGGSLEYGVTVSGRAKWLTDFLELFVTVWDVGGKTVILISADRQTFFVGHMADTLNACAWKVMCDVVFMISMVGMFRWVFRKHGSSLVFGSLF